MSELRANNGLTGRQITHWDDVRVEGVAGMHFSADGDWDSELLNAARALCFRAFGDRFSDEDWQHSFGGGRWVLLSESEVIVHAAVVPRTIVYGDIPLAVGYVEAVAVDPDHQGQGLGRLLMREVNAWIQREYELGLLSTSRQSFYSHAGWARWQGPTFVRDLGVTRRTEDEDDGIMFLATPRLAHVDVSQALTCEARDGDDW